MMSNPVPTGGSVLERPPAAVSSRLTNVAQTLTRHARQRPEAIAVVQDGPARQTISWSEVDRRVEAGAAVLGIDGLVASHRVALLGPADIDWVAGYFRALRAGLVVVPLGYWPDRVDGPGPDGWFAPELATAAVSSFCTATLARYKRPAVVRMVAELPHGPTGKVRKGQLRRQLAGPGHLPDPVPEPAGYPATDPNPEPDSSTVSAGAS